MDRQSLSDWLETPSLEISGGLVGVPCSLYRGATSKGPVFREGDLPSDPVLRDRVILAALNPEHPGQIDGIGGAETLSNKVIIVGKSDRPDTDVNYTFLQYTPGTTKIDRFGNSVNMGASVGPFSVENGYVTPTGDETEIRIFAVNAGLNYTSRVRTPDGRISFDGETAIDGVAGTSAPVILVYRPPFGNLLGSLFPSGRRLDVIQDVPVTIIDAGGTVCMIVRADSFGKTGYESKAEFDGDDPLAEELEIIRQQAGRLIGMKDYTQNTTPGTIMIARAKGSGSIASRKLTTYRGAPARCHAAFSGSGAVCLATASILSGTIVDGIASGLDRAGTPIDFIIEHPSGMMKLSVEKEPGDDENAIRGISLTRTSRKLFSGMVYVPLNGLR